MILKWLTIIEILSHRINIIVPSSVSEEDDESEESEDEDVFVPKDFVEVRQDDVQKFYCIEEEVGR